MNQFSNKRPDWRRISLIALCAVLALVLILLVFATTYANYLLNKLGRDEAYYDGTLSPEELATATEELDPDYTGETIHQGDIVLDTIDPVGGGKEGIVNILLVGQDRRPGESRQRSDAMILCTFNNKINTVTLTSFLRDTYVSIPGYGNRKLNAAYQLGGFSLLNQTLATNFGVHVDANIEVDFDGFVEVIDLLGGVTITLDQSEAAYINKNMGYSCVSAGTQVLTGQQALWHSRNRSTGNSYDFGRTQRQRQVLTALLSAYKNQSLGTMLGLIDDILPMITTNMTNQEILNYATKLFPLLSKAQMTTQSIPASGTYSEKYVSGIGSCLIPDLAANREILKDVLK